MWRTVIDNIKEVAGLSHGVGHLNNKYLYGYINFQGKILISHRFLCLKFSWCNYAFYEIGLQSYLKTLSFLRKKQTNNNNK